MPGILAKIGLGKVTVRLLSASVALSCRLLTPDPLSCLYWGFAIHVFIRLRSITLGISINCRMQRILCLPKLKEPRYASARLVITWQWSILSGMRITAHLSVLCSTSSKCHSDVLQNPQWIIGFDSFVSVMFQLITFVTSLLAEPYFKIGSPREKAEAFQHKMSGTGRSSKSHRDLWLHRQFSELVTHCYYRSHCLRHSLAPNFLGGWVFHYKKKM